MKAMLKLIDSSDVILLLIMKTISIRRLNLLSKNKKTLIDCWRSLKNINLGDNLKIVAGDLFLINYSS